MQGKEDEEKRKIEEGGEAEETRFGCPDSSVYDHPWESNILSDLQFAIAFANKVNVEKKVMLFVYC